MRLQETLKDLHKQTERLVTARDNNFNLPVVVVTPDILQCCQIINFPAVSRRRDPPVYNVGGLTY